MTDAIPTRAVRLSPWLRVADAEAYFPTRDGGAPILKDRVATLLDERLSPVRLRGGPPEGTFQPTHADRLSDGGVALASARSRRGDTNLRLFDADGAFRTAFPVGDGVEHLLADGAGRLWVGYFDEGIFSGDPLSARATSRSRRRARRPAGSAWRAA